MPSTDSAVTTVDWRELHIVVRGCARRSTSTRATTAQTIQIAIVGDRGISPRDAIQTVRIHKVFGITSRQPTAAGLTARREINHTLVITVRLKITGAGDDHA